MQLLQSRGRLQIQSRGRFGQLFRLFLTLTFFFAGLSSCNVNKPSYPSDTVVSSLEKMLLEEYDIHALVKQTEKTLGVCITVPTLLVSGKKSLSVVNDQIRNVMSCLRRVLLSTDAPIDFYQITLRGKDTLITEISLVHYLLDLKIHILSGISQEDFSKRAIYRNQINSDFLSKERVKLFFNDLKSQDPRHVLFSHFGSDIQDISIPKDFSLQMHESAMKLHLQYDITDLRTKIVNEGISYIYCTVNETFEPKQGFQDFRFSTYSGQTQTYLFKIVTTGNPRAQIMEMFLKGDIESKPQAQWNAVVRQLGKPESWASSDFYMFSYDFKTFIAEQIADRVQSDLVKNSDDKVTKDENALEHNTMPRVAGVRGFFENNSFKFLFHYRNVEKNVAKKDIELTLATTKIVCQSYHFREIKNIKVGTLYGNFSSHPIF